MLNLGYVGRIDIGGERAGIFCHRSLPLCDGHLEIAGLLIDLAEMIVNCGVCVDTLICLTQVFFCESVLAGLVIGPSERVQKRAILRIEIDRFADQGEGFRKLNTAVGQHIAEIIQDGCVLGVDGQGFAELRFGFVVAFLAVEEGSTQEDDI